MKKIKVVIATLLVAALAGGGFWYWRSQQASKTANYVTQPVSAGHIVQAVSANGTLQPVTLVSVGSQVSGRVKALYADFNSRVKKGQLLMELDDELLGAQLAQSEANLASAQATLSLAESNFQRVESLFKQEFVSKQEFDQSRQALQSARAAVLQTTAARQRDRINVGNTKIYSPVSGIVIARQVDAGQTVAASLQAPTLFQIAQDLREMRIDSSFSEADVGQIKAGMPATFRVDAFSNREFKGVVKEIRLNPTTVQNVVTYNVVISLNNPDEALLPGMTAYVNITLASRENVLRVSNSALRFKPSVTPERSAASRPANRSASRPEGAGRGNGRGGSTVFVLENGKPKPVRVKLGISDGRYTEILGGDLKEGDLLITEEVATDKKNGAASVRVPGRMF